MVDMVLTIFASSGAAQKQGRAVRSTMTVKRPSRALRIGPASGPQAAQLQSSAELQGLLKRKSSAGRSECTAGLATVQTLCL
jgi:hypothetical protein